MACVPVTFDISGAYTETSYPERRAGYLVSSRFCPDLPRTFISTTMANETGHGQPRDEKISPPSPDSNEKVGDLPDKVLTDDPTQNEYYRQFVDNGAEWQANFEAKLKRKVDLRLIPLLVRTA